MPNKERKRKVVLRTDEYSRMLSEAGGKPRDFAILQLFIQTGLRVSELIAITLGDLNLQNRVLKVHGKGNKEREIPLEKKSVQALKSWLAVRPESQDRHLFLNYTGDMNTSLPYHFTEPPARLKKARFDNIALVPASLLPLKDTYGVSVRN